MKNIWIALLFLPTLSFAGTATTYFGSGGGTIIFASGTVASAPPASSSSTLVQSAQDGGTSNNFGASFGGNTVAGNLIYVSVGQADATFTTSSLFDGCGDTFTEAPNSPVTGTGNRVRVFTAITSGGCSSVNYGSSVNAAYNFAIAEYSNPTAASYVDCDTGGTGNSANLLTSSPACTTTHAGDTLIATGFQPTNSATYTAGASYTIRQQNGGTGHSFVFEDRHVTATGTYTGSATSDTSAQWAIHMTALKANP